MSTESSTYFQNGVCQKVPQNLWFSTQSQELACTPPIIWFKESWRKEAEGNYQKLWGLAALYRNAGDLRESMRQYWSIIQTMVLSSGDTTANWYLVIHSNDSKTEYCQLRHFFVHRWAWKWIYFNPISWLHCLGLEHTYVLSDHIRYMKMFENLIEHCISNLTFV